MADHIPGRVDRRAFLQAAALSPLAWSARQQSLATPWRSFELTFAVKLIDATRDAILWLPLPDRGLLPGFQRVDDIVWETTAHPGQVREIDNVLVARWDAAAAVKDLTLSLRVSTRDRAAGPNPGPASAAIAADDAARYLQPTRWIPIDGIVRDTALKIVQGHGTPLARARAIYDWIVENTFRDPAVKGCGTGDIRGMLVSGSLGGKCADLNALFVGLCRSAGLPARDLYGIRVAPSARYTSLGRADDITTAQHCRAEVFVDRHGWIPVDPADVRKVVLEERPGSTLADAHAVRARRELFGSWEMNWIAFNDRHDVELPGATEKMLPFFMYPQAEVGGVRRDSLEPARFSYRITARELTASRSRP